MEKPSNCPDELYAVMLDCWQHDVKMRPNFTTLKTALKQIYNHNIVSEYN